MKIQKMQRKKDTDPTKMPTSTETKPSTTSTVDPKVQASTSTSTSTSTNINKPDNKTKKKEPEKTTASNPKTEPTVEENSSQVEDNRLKYELSENTTFFVSEIGNVGALYQSRAGSVIDAETDDLPVWVVECLVYKKLNAPETPKVSFYLNPFTPCDDELPQLPHFGNKLNAIRILTIRKVVTYVISKLNLQLPVSENPEIPTVNEDYIEILCNDKVLPPDMSLATIKQFLWKSSDELTLFYRKTQKYCKK